MDRPAATLISRSVHGVVLKQAALYPVGRPRVIEEYLLANLCVYVCVGDIAHQMESALQQVMAVSNGTPSASKKAR